MCNLYQLTPKGSAERAVGLAGLRLVGDDWQPGTVGPFQSGAFIVQDGSGDLRAVVGQWGMIRPGQPERKPEKRYSTNNARVESVATKPTYAHAWRKGQRCLVPADWYAEPNWETGKNIWWHLRRSDGAPWFLAGLWSEWTEQATGEVVPNFTLITCNCDDHPLLSRLHKPDPKLPPDQQDKRSLAHLNPAQWAQWLHGTTEEALQLIAPQPVEVFDQTDARRTDELLAGSASGELF